MFTIDRKVFFDAIRPVLYPKGLTQQAVDGLEYILATWEKGYQDRTPLTQFAAVLGQVHLETAHTMQPIHEYGDAGYFFRMYDVGGSRPQKARELGNVNPGDGARFAGMGYIQSTGRANARRATRRMRELGLIRADVDFEESPELLMRPEYAVHVMFLGMEEGWFTGRRLDDVVDAVEDGDEHADFVKARAIINGSDKAGLIADYSDAFLAALRAARRDAPAAAPEPPRVSPADTGANVKPVEVPTAADPAPKGWFERLLELMRSHRGRA